jgi:hypothetical protein
MNLFAFLTLLCTFLGGPLRQDDKCSSGIAAYLA